MDIGPIIAFSLERLRILESAISAIEESKNPVFGYLFAGKKLREVARKLREECKIRDCDSPQGDLAKLKLWRNNLNKIRDHLASFSLDAEFEVAVVLIGGKLVGTGKEPLVPEPVLYAARRTDEAMRLATPLLVAAQGKFYPALLDGDGSPMELLDQLGALKLREAHTRLS